MSELINRTARLTPYAKRPRQAASYVTAATFEPAPDDLAAALGTLFIVLEVLSSGRIAEEVAQLIIETLSQRYYDGAASPDRPLLDRFEAAIKLINGELSRYIDQGNGAWVGKLSSVVAVQSGAELHLAQTGSAEAFLSRGRLNTRITTSRGPRGPQANKTFGTIISGTLESGDRLLLATPALIHQLPLDRLRSVMANRTPAGTIAEISDLLEHTDTIDRIAALSVEILTPDEAALQVRSDEPDDVILQTTPSPLTTARLATAPVAKSAVSSGKRLSQTASAGAATAAPILRRTGSAVWRGAGCLLAKRAGRYTAVAVIAALVIIVTTINLSARQEARLKQLQQRFVADYSTLQQTQQLLNGPTKATAEARLSAAAADVKSLSQSPDHLRLDRRLASAQLPNGAPRSLAALLTAINQQLDQAEKVVRIAPQAVATLPTPATRLELIGGQLLALTSNGQKLYRVDPTGGGVTASTAALGRIGPIAATVVNSSGDGLIIYGQSSGAWLYQPGNDRLAALTVGTGSWPAAQAIASYNGNLYLLTSDGSVQRALRTLSGYAPPATILDPGAEPPLSGARAMAIDGSIYLLTSAGLVQYLGGVLQQTVTVPTSLSHAATLRMSGDGRALLACDASTGRIGLFTANGNQLSFNRQYALTGYETVSDAVTDPTGTTVYALSGDRIVSFSLR